MCVRACVGVCVHVHVCACVLASVCLYLCFTPSVFKCIELWPHEVSDVMHINLYVCILNVPILCVFLDMLNYLFQKYLWPK